MELYLVKSSGEDEWGNEYWENLQIFNDVALAEQFADKVQKLIDDDESTDKVEIENFTLRTREDSI